jgi:hypothetical protein
MAKTDDTLFGTRLKDLDRLHELGFIDWEERGIRVHEVLLQEISEELDRLVQISRHQRISPLINKSV